MLGGNPEPMAMAELKQRGIEPVESPEEYEAAWGPTLEKLQHQVETEHYEVIELGGLYVLGTERHESRRIDNQLRGRSGRQGDPGESRFYLSLQDDLMRLFKSEWVDMILRSLNIPDDQPIEHKRVSNAIKGAQSQREAQNFEIRKDVLKYDDVLNRQRQVIYEERRMVLAGGDLSEQIGHMLDESVAAYVQGATSEGYPEAWDLDQLWTALRTLYPVSMSIEEIEDEAGGRDGLTSELLTQRLVDDARAAYALREAELGSEAMRELELRVLLTVLDRKWREHLYEMDYLREGIGLRAFAQKQPLVEYQREGFDLFSVMMDAIKEESVGLLFHLDARVVAPSADGADAQAAPAVAAPVVVAKGLVEAKRPQQLQYTAPSIDGEGAVEQRVEGSGSTDGSRSAAAAGPAPAGVAFVGASRNKPCPCGSGKKYKLCHGAAQNRPR